jgi:hypothetical protein
MRGFVLHQREALKAIFTPCQLGRKHPMAWNPEEDRKLFEALLVVVSYGQPNPKLQSLFEEQLRLREQMVAEQDRTVH